MVEENITKHNFQSSFNFHLLLSLLNSPHFASVQTAKGPKIESFLSLKSTTHYSLAQTEGQDAKYIRESINKPSMPKKEDP